jgi:DNA polymerase-1
MQGTAADLIKMAMINVQKLILENSFSSKMILQVHDELIFETPSGEVDKFSHSLRQVMCSVAKLSVPLEVEIGFGENWEQAH